MFTFFSFLDKELLEAKAEESTQTRLKYATDATSSQGKMAQCGKFIIFPSLIFYVKSILGILDRCTKNDICILSEALNLHFYEVLHFLKV